MPILQPMGTLGLAYRQSPAPPLPPPTPVTGEVVNSREVWNRRSGALRGTAPTVRRSSAVDSGIQRLLKPAFEHWPRR